jgi:hypothetical protein
VIGWTALIVTVSYLRWRPVLCALLPTLLKTFKITMFCVTDCQSCSVTKCDVEALEN